MYFNMIKKTLLISLLLLLIYNGGLIFKLIPVDFHQSSAFYENVKIAEKFVFEETIPKIVFTGSSVFQYIGFNEIDNSCNLSFFAGSGIQGLELILKSDKIPDLVIVETNSLYAQNLFNVNNQIFPFFHLHLDIQLLQYLIDLTL